MARLLGLATADLVWDAGDRPTAHALAAGSTVLVDREGTRYVRTGWFRSYVRREVGGLYSPAALAAQMERVGWRRPGSQGRVEATSPSDGRSLVWTFYTVPGRLGAGERVNAGAYRATRVRVRTRVLERSPAFTGGGAA